MVDTADIHEKYHGSKTALHGAASRGSTAKDIHEKDHDGQRYTGQLVGKKGKCRCRYSGLRNERELQKEQDERQLQM
jgi:hypothetical protein